MKDDRWRELREEWHRPGTTLRTIELLTKLEADVASILGAPPIRVSPVIYGRRVSRALRRGRDPFC